ncbi:MAG TPA: hypothetical protein VFJ51_05870 [Nitrososphaeraceae archaeon]|nr:hypothetical protein [Nitrososphaeraceae archaeon]
MMPEIWLKYGSTDIVLNIRYENLLKHISSDFPLLMEDEIRLRLSNVVLADDTLIFALSDTKLTAKIIILLLDMAQAKGFANVTIGVPQRIEHVLGNNLAEKATSVKEITYQSFPNIIDKFRNILFISQTIYDPLFGYGIIPTKLLRNYYREGMSEAFNARQDNLPKPGVRGPPLKIALSNTENIPAKSIELVANSFGIAGIHYGNIIEASQNAIGHLDSISTIEIEPTKSAIISASSEIGGHSTLSESLNSLWNTIHIVREDGSAILLSENQRGIGGGALQMYIEGRLKMEEQLKSSYTYGLEHMLYLDELVQKGQLGIVSTLPQYYLKKLRLDTYTSLKNVLEKLLVKYGKNHKVLVVSDADIAYLKKKT